MRENIRFIRISIGSESEILSSLKEADWSELYAIGKQSLRAVLRTLIRQLSRMR